MSAILDQLKACSQHFDQTGQVHPDTHRLLRDYEQFVADRELGTILEIMKTQLDRQELSNKIKAIKTFCVGDGCGLKTGTYVDDLVTAFFKTQLAASYSEHHIGEADMKICNVPLSLKTCTNPTGTQFALNWSKNKTQGDETKNFETHIMIIVSENGHWWKRDEPVKAGIYLVDRFYCKDNIVLSSNNKTDKLITKRDVYKMVTSTKHFLELPDPNESIRFCILDAFQPKVFSPV